MSKTSPDVSQQHRLIADFQPITDSAAPTAHPEIFVEDDRTGMHPVTLERAVLDYLYYTCLNDSPSATLLNVYEAVISISGLSVAEPRYSLRPSPALR